MQYLSGFELYSRWVPLVNWFDVWLKLFIDFNTNASAILSSKKIRKTNHFPISGDWEINGVRLIPSIGRKKMLPPFPTPLFFLMWHQNAKPSGGFPQKPVSWNWESLVIFVGDMWNVRRKEPHWCQLLTIYNCALLNKVMNSNDLWNNK